jgi:outer membrane murein-binding lipoprotein Lpp
MRPTTVPPSSLFPILVASVLLAGCDKNESRKVNDVSGAVMSTTSEYETYDQSLSDLSKGQPE